MVATDLGIGSVAELIGLMRKDEGKRTFASSGVGTSAHLAGELFAEAIGLPLTHVPYRGTAPALIDVSTGRVTFMFDQMTAASALLQSGQLKLLAVTAEKRLAPVPDVPTMIEAGVPGFAMDSWQAVYAPRGTPRPIVDRLNAAIVSAVHAPDVQRTFGVLGVVLVGSTPAELAALTEREITRWAAVVKRSGTVAN